MIKGFVLFIGPSAAGKTSILRRLVTGKFQDQEPTLGISQENISKVRIIEIGGQPSLREYWKVALDQKPSKIFFIIDIMKESDFSEYLTFIKENSELHPQLSETTILIANKVDLTDSIPNHLNLDNFFIKSSAKSGEGMLDILEIIASLKPQTVSVEREAQDIKPAVEKKNDSKIEEEKAKSLLEEFQGKF